MEVTRIRLDEWSDALPNTGFEVFHDPDALAVLDDHADAELQLYGAYKGQQAVGLLPLFVGSRSVGRTAFSPPISFSVPRLGPLINPASPKRSKRERINTELVENVVETLDLTNRSTLFRMSCPIEYTDPRPYSWREFTVKPNFTYIVDCSQSETIDDAMGGFSRSLRKEMRQLDDLDLSIETEGIETAHRIYDDVAEQYRAHDDTVPMSHSFLDDLLHQIDDDRWRVYVARTPDGEYKGGIVTLYSNDLAYFWQGGVAASYENISVNTLLHRVIIEDILTDPELDSIHGYDLVGANTKRLCEYKAKFNADLRAYYVVESSGLEMSLAKSAYQKINGAFGR